MQISNELSSTFWINDALVYKLIQTMTVESIQLAISCLPLDARQEHYLQSLNKSWLQK